MFNEKFWLAIAFTCFAVIILKYVWPLIAKALDGRSKQIAEDILAAKELKEKAEQLLASVEKYKIESEKFAEKLLHDAEVESKKLLIAAKESADNEIKKKTEAALERIKVEEASAIRDIKAHIVESTMENINKELEKNIGTTEQEKIFDLAIEKFKV